MVLIFIRASLYYFLHHYIVIVNPRNFMKAKNFQNFDSEYFQIAYRTVTFYDKVSNQLVSFKSDDRALLTSEK